MIATVFVDCGVGTGFNTALFGNTLSNAMHITPHCYLARSCSRGWMLWASFVFSGNAIWGACSRSIMLEWGFSAGCLLRQHLALNTSTAAPG